MQLVLASGNAGKLNELQSMLAPLGHTVISQQQLGISSAPEPYATFIENALTKARHAADASRLPALADDSGLVVPSLDGAPGVRSARFAGPDATDQDNNRALVAAVFKDAADNTPVAAHFYCALVFLRSAQDPAPIIATGRWFGQFRAASAGTGGFGYDPHFYLPDLQKTAGQLGATEKNQLSHRGQATRLLIAQLREQLNHTD